MKDNVRQELKELCYFIIENNNALSRPEQLTRVQMLYERLLVLNYLEEIEAEKKAEKANAKLHPSTQHKSSEQGSSAAVPSPETKAPSSHPSRPHAEEENPREPTPVTTQAETPTKPLEESAAKAKENRAAADEKDSPVAEEAHTKSDEEDEAATDATASSDPVSKARPEDGEEKPASEPRDKDLEIEAKPSESREPKAEPRDLNDGHQAPKSINDHLGKGAIQVGLNDRIAFVKHLFNDSQADFNRVLSQLNTLDTYLESMYFIENLVKPDYDWEDKKPYEERLINLIKKRFGEDW